MARVAHRWPIGYCSNVAGRDPTEFIEAFGALSKALKAFGARTYAALGLGSTQAKFLRHIGKHGRISQADLSRATDTHPTLTGRGLEPLIERGWVRRKRNEEDRREYVLELTAAGERVRKRVDDARVRFAEHIVAQLDDRDIADFDRIAKKLLVASEGTVDPG